VTYKCKWEYTLKKIADASGKSINSVRDDKQSGAFDPDNQKSVSLYIASNIMKKEARI